MQIKTILVMLVFLTASNFVSADIITGKVKRIYPQGDLIYFRIVGDACKTNKYWYFTLQSEVSKAWFSMLLAAATTQSEVLISYSGSCDASINQQIDYVVQDFNG